MQPDHLLHDVASARHAGRVARGLAVHGAPHRACPLVRLASRLASSSVPRPPAAAAVPR